MPVKLGFLRLWYSQQPTVWLTGKEMAVVEGSERSMGVRVGSWERMWVRSKAIRTNFMQCNSIMDHFLQHKNSTQALLPIDQFLEAWQFELGQVSGCKCKLDATPPIRISEESLLWIQNVSYFACLGQELRVRSDQPVYTFDIPSIKLAATLLTRRVWPRPEAASPSSPVPPQNSIPCSYLSIAHKPRQSNQLQIYAIATRIRQIDLAFVNIQCIKLITNLAFGRPVIRIIKRPTIQNNHSSSSSCCCLATRHGSTRKNTRGCSRVPNISKTRRVPNTKLHLALTAQTTFRGNMGTARILISHLGSPSYSRKALGANCKCTTQRRPKDMQNRITTTVATRRQSANPVTARAIKAMFTKGQMRIARKSQRCLKVPLLNTSASKHSRIFKQLIYELTSWFSLLTLLLTLSSSPYALDLQTCELTKMSPQRQQNSHPQRQLMWLQPECLQTIILQFGQRLNLYFLLRPRLTCLSHLPSCYSQKHRAQCFCWQSEHFSYGTQSKPSHSSLRHSLMLGLVRASRLLRILASLFRWKSARLQQKGDCWLNSAKHSLSGHLIILKLLRPQCITARMHLLQNRCCSQQNGSKMSAPTIQLQMLQRVD